jgi:hypothetical protein
MTGLDALTILIAKESMLPWPMAERLAKAIIRGGWQRQEQSAPEPATSYGNISAENHPANRSDHIGMKR